MEFNLHQSILSKSTTKPQQNVSGLQDSDTSRDTTGYPVL